MKIGILGMGIVGTAIYNGFKNNNNIYRYDINNKYDTIEDVVYNSNIIFICVPTPTNNKLNQNKNQQDISCLDAAIDSINIVSRLKKTIVIKSTILPGTTRKYASRYPWHNFVFNPEFLTARTANKDFMNQVQIILGGNELDTVEKLYEETFPLTLIKKVSWEEAELLKYTCNTFYATKVVFANQIYDMCKKLDICYENVKQLFIDNGWVCPMHLDVPGPDGKRGFGGECFPKDLQAFISWGEDMGMDMSVFLELFFLNEKIRKEK